ncbi:hypothetical protein B0H16DRAFT_1842098 [Mycena metata]|uniref:Zuotin-like zuotin homology domain-containing protein n=1 Tax=Mycena metata TaxID=1033252 RepID=A0AAD7N9Y4_9AGAR|nr:hypothetical protein B0H16DRAFT_1842098 [Mycena metata]
MDLLPHAIPGIVAPEPPSLWSFREPPSCAFFILGIPAHGLPSTPTCGLLTGQPSPFSAQLSLSLAHTYTRTSLLHTPLVAHHRPCILPGNDRISMFQGTWPPPPQPAAAQPADDDSLDPKEWKEPDHSRPQPSALHRRKKVLHDHLDKKASDTTHPSAANISKFRDDKRYTEKKNKSERARRKEDIARVLGIVDLCLSVDPRIKHIKQHEKEAREAKKTAGAPGKKAPVSVAQAAKSKQEEEEKKRKEEEKAAKAEAKKAKKAAANAAKKARRAERAAEEGGA